MAVAVSRKAETKQAKESKQAKRLEEYRKRRDLVNRAFDKNWDRFTDDLFDRAYQLGITWSEWAWLATVAYNTVAKIGYYETKRPHFMTVWKLARAIGCEVPLECTKEFHNRKKREG